MDKKFKTLNEQIEILKSKGLIIEDEEQAKDILFKENYFFINGYRYIFFKSSKDKTYIPGATFHEQYSLFLFDRYFRNILFKNLLIIENNLKSIISYQLSKKYGYKEKDYLNAKNFTNDPAKARRVRDILEKMKRQIRINGSQHNATLHYLNNYGYIPLWILVKVLSFGIISDLFTILKPDDKIAISEIYQVSVDTLEDYLPLLANYRNLCAHEDIIYDNKTEKYIPNNKYHQLLNIPKTDNEYIYGKNDVFAIVIIMKSMLSDDEFRSMLKEMDYEIQKLSGKLHSVSIEKILDRMGFPSNYIELIEL